MITDERTGRQTATALDKAAQVSKKSVLGTLDFQLERPEPLTDNQGLTIKKIFFFIWSCD